MTTSLRCPGNLYGILSDDGKTIEVKCKRRSCGAQSGYVVLHTISLATGQTIETKIFLDPNKRKEG